MNYLLIILFPNYQLKHKASFTNQVSNYGTFLTFIVRISENKIEILISFLFESNFILNTLKNHSFYFILTNSLVLLHKQSHRIFHILNSFHCVNLTYQKCIISFSFLNSKLAFKMIWKKQ